MSLLSQGHSSGSGLLFRDDVMVALLTPTEEPLHMMVCLCTPVCPQTFLDPTITRQNTFLREPCVCT